MSCALRLLAWAVARLPWRALALLGRALGFVAGRVFGIRRDVVLSAMRRAEVPAPHDEADAMYAGLGRGLFELLWLAGAGEARRRSAVGRWVTLDARLTSALDSACARGPVVLAAAHTGNWELVAYAAARMLAERGRRLGVVVKRQSVRAVDVFCTNLRRASGLILVPPAGALARARAILAAGDVVAMAIDQVPDRESQSLPVRFLGADASADRSPAALAYAARATMLVVGARRAGRELRVELLAEIAPPTRETHATTDFATTGAEIARSRRTWVTSATELATERLDAFVRETPSTWLWLHRRWRAPRDASARDMGVVGSADARASARLVATGHPG